MEGAAANALPDPVDADLQEARRERFMAVQARISTARLARKVGTTQTVLIDGHEEHRRGRQRHVAAVGRSAADAPEIDGLVRVEDGAALKPGSFAQVRCQAAGEHDLSRTAGQALQPSEAL